MRNWSNMIYFKRRRNIAAFDFRPGIDIEIPDREQVVAFKNPLRDTQLFGHETNRGNPTTLSIAAIAHLRERLQQMAPGHLFIASDPDYTATTLRLHPT